MNLTLRIWRQQNTKAPGGFATYRVMDVAPDMSFLEMLDKLNEEILGRGEPPVAFEHDCREGICGSCGFLIDGVAHGGRRGTTVCQLSMRFFKDGDSLTLEPWRSAAFPIVRDLIVRYAKGDWRSARFREWRDAVGRADASFRVLWPTRSLDDELLS